MSAGGGTVGLWGWYSIDGKDLHHHVSVKIVIESWCHSPQSVTSWDELGFMRAKKAILGVVVGWVKGTDSIRSSTLAWQVTV